MTVASGVVRARMSNPDFTVVPGVGQRILMPPAAPEFESPLQGSGEGGRDALPGAVLALLSDDVENRCSESRPSVAEIVSDVVTLAMNAVVLGVEAPTIPSGMELPSENRTSPWNGAAPGRASAVTTSTSWGTRQARRSAGRASSAAGDQSPTSPEADARGGLDEDEVATTSSGAAPRATSP
ncbi:hypothetical protein [Amnibacterium kyonggiense]